MAVTTRWALAGISMLLLGGACSASDDTAVDVRVVDPVIGAAAAGANAALYGEIDGGADRLLDVRTTVAQRITVMAAGTEMSAAAADNGFPIPIDRGDPLVFVPGTSHLMLERVERDLAAGSSVEVEFVFERAGVVALDVPVVEPADLAERVPR